MTTILERCIDKPFLRTWYGKLGTEAAQKQARESAALGTRVHSACEAIHRGDYQYRGDGALGVSAEMAPFAEAYLAWFLAEVTEVVAAEKQVWSLEHGYAGTLDAALLLKGDTVPTLVDLKTSHSQQPQLEWRLQTVAYQVALLESAGIATRKRLIVQLPSNAPGEMRLHELPVGRAAARDWQAFRACLELYQWLEDEEER